MQFCACGSGQLYLACCGRFIEGGQSPKTPEQLMRSRYTAFTQANIPYIQKTMRGKAAEGFDAVDAKKWAQQSQWQGLQVLKASQQGKQGEVEFIASYLWQNQAMQLRECSLFEQIDGLWYYIDRA